MPVSNNGLENENGEGPEHEYEARLLLIVFDNHRERSLGHVARVGLHRLGFLFHESACIRANNGHINSVHDDDRNKKRKDLINKLGREMFLHRMLKCPREKRRHCLRK